MRLAFFTACLAIMLPSATAYSGWDLQLVNTGGDNAVGSSSGTFDLLATRNGASVTGIAGLDITFDLVSASPGLGPIQITNTAKANASWLYIDGSVATQAPNVGESYQYTLFANFGAPETINIASDTPVVLGSFEFTTSSPFDANESFVLGNFGGNATANPTLVLSTGSGLPPVSPGVGSSFSAVPEPSSALVLGLLGGVLCLRRRKSSQS